MSTQASRSKNSNRRRNRPSNQARRPAPNTSNLVTKRALSGGKITPPSNPPDVTYQPWYPTTLVISHSTALNWTTNSVLSYLRSQIDPTKRGFNQKSNPTDDNRFVIQYRLLSVTAWNLTGRVIALSVDDFSDTFADSGARDQLCGLVDTGTSIHTPAVGYVLPYHLQHHVLRTDDKQGDMNLFDVTTNSGNCVTYVKILWRFDGPIKHPSIVSPINEIEEVVTTISNKIVKTQEASKLELVVNGIKYVAQAVAVLGSGSDVRSLPAHLERVVIDDSDDDDIGSQKTTSP